MNIEQTLGRAGLNIAQQTIYLTLLTTPDQTVAELARSSGLNRPLVYKTLPELESLGLVVNLHKGKRIKYTALSPDRLRTLLADSLTELEAGLPVIKQLYDQSVSPQQVSVYKGKDNIKHVFSDLIQTLNKGEVFYRYSARKESKNGESYLPKDYRKIRDEKQLQRFVITNAKIAKQKKPRLERELKVLPEKFSLFNDGVTVLIYGSKIAFIDYNTDTATVIDNSTIAEFQKRLFKTLYSLI